MVTLNLEMATLTKLREGNVFTRVCQSGRGDVHGLGGMHVPPIHDLQNTHASPEHACQPHTVRGEGAYIVYESSLHRHS